MKLSKKLMLFEEFTQTGTEVATEVAIDTTTQVSQPTDSVRTDIVSDVDSIISKLEDLARGIGQEETNESFILTEGAADKILGAELYMIPIIATGLVGGAAVGAGVLIKKAITKKKIKKSFLKNVHKPKMQAAKIEIAIDSLNESILETESTNQQKPKGAQSEVQKASRRSKYAQKGADAADAKKKKAKAQVDKFKKQIEELRKGANEFSTALSQKFKKYSDFISVLNAETNMEISKFMLDKGNLSDSEIKKYKKQYSNAKSSLDKAIAESDAKKKKAEEAAKNLSDAQQKEMEAKRKEAQEEVDSSDR